MAEALWKMNLYSCMLILYVLVVRRVIRKYSKLFSYSLWVLVAARLWVPVFLNGPFSIRPILLAGFTGNILPADVTAVLKVLYFLGVFAVAGMFMSQYWKTRSQVRLAVRETKNIWRCEGSSSAFVMGLIHPRIYIPYGLEGTKQWYVVQHEKMHIRHGDPWISAAAMVTLCLHWWNPLVWYSACRMWEDMEMYCDEAVLEECAGQEKKIYSEILLELSASQSGFPALCFGKSHTERRIRNLLQGCKKEHLWFRFLYMFAINLSVWLLF